MEKQQNDSDLKSLGLRLMRKDDLVVIPQNSRTPRAPENFQGQYQSVRIPTNVQRIISMAIDSTGINNSF